RPGIAVGTGDADAHLQRQGFGYLPARLPGAWLLPVVEAAILQVHRAQAFGQYFRRRALALLHYPAALHQFEADDKAHAFAIALDPQPVEVRTAAAEVI